MAGCGGTAATQDPVDQVPMARGFRERVPAATAPQAAEFPAAKGRTLEQLASGVTSGPTLAKAGSVYIEGENRFAFGVIDQHGQPVYGPTAVYVAPTPASAAQGPYVAPADVLLTNARYRSKQAATEEDPFAAIYAADLRFSKPGKWYVLVVTQTGGRRIGAPGDVEVSTRAADRIPQVGDRLPAIHTDTLETAKGDVSRIDTRVPPSDMHDDLANVLGRKPIVSKGLRAPLTQLGLQTEPWLFVVDRSGIVPARLEGSFGVAAFERAVKSGL
jgi:hypothetical protein